MNIQTVKFGEICNLVNGKTYKASEWVNEGLPIVRIQNLKDPNKPFNYWDKGIDRQVAVSRGDVLLAWSGTPGTSFGAHKWKGPSGVLNQHIFRVDLDEDAITKEWAILSVNKQLNKLIDRAHGGVGLKHVTKGVVQDLDIPLPSLDYQKQSETILNKASSVIRKRQKSIELSEQLMDSVFLEMFGDPIDNAKGWDVVRLDSVCSKITDGVHFKPNYVDSGVPFISVKNITTGKLIFDACKYISMEDHQKYIKRCKPEYGDILYTKIGATYGRPAIVDTYDEFSLYVSVALIKPKKELIKPEFLLAALSNPAIKHQADRSIKGAGVPDLHLVEIKSFLIPLPPIKIQDEFVSIVKSIHSKAGKLSTAHEYSVDLLNSLSQRAFKGELN